MIPQRLFVTGIGTGVGKTVVSAALVQALKADYWKPVQSGISDEEGDTERVRSLVTSGGTFHPESYRLGAPLSPHAAAARERMVIDLEKIVPPETSNRLIIEGAGGVLVPLNDDQLIIDLMAALQSPVVVVSQHYLGSINHSLLTLESLERRSIPVAGIVFNGDANPDSETVILKRSGLPLLGRMPLCETVSPGEIASAAGSLLQGLKRRYEE